LSNTIWNTLVPAVDKNLCGFEVTAVPTTEENLLMGGFWAGISKISTAKGNTGSRSDIDQARMQMLQQYLAAVINVARFGSNTEAFLAAARAAYCGSDLNAIKAQIGILGTYNESGDSGLFTPGVSATTKLSKDQADIDAWDIPQFPGVSDEDGVAPKLALAKVLQNGGTGTALPADFTLKATCTTGCGTTTLTGNPNAPSTTVQNGVYTLTDVGVSQGGRNAATYTPLAPGWTCTGTGSFAVGATTAGTATLAVANGAMVSCTITNTHP
jgi:hypothetical protein